MRCGGPTRNWGIGDDRVYCIPENVVCLLFISLGWGLVDNLNVRRGLFHVYSACI